MLLNSQPVILRVKVAFNTVSNTLVITRCLPSRGSKTDKKPSRSKRVCDYTQDPETTYKIRELQRLEPEKMAKLYRDDRSVDI